MVNSFTSLAIEVIGEVMPKKMRRKYFKEEKIIVPAESIEKIDILIDSGKTFFTSRNEFIQKAVEKKLKESEGIDIERY